jgi:[NiFe] hydrogenase assembly HybE family chaperone
MRSAESLAAELESTFERIRVERMSDVPILNSKLGVEAVGFEPHESELIGVLVTPWFMNLMLVPSDPDAPATELPGETRVSSFPAGNFEFIAGFEDGLGHYRMCSLFSPMFDFADHAAAVATAEAVMAGIMTPDQEGTDSEKPAPRRMSRRELFRQLSGSSPA